MQLRSEAGYLTHSKTNEDCSYSISLIQALIEACAGNYESLREIVQLQIVEILNILLILIPSEAADHRQVWSTIC